MISPLSHRFVQAKWGGFHLKDLFEIKSSIKRFDANKVTVFERGHHPYIIRSGSNNGQRGYLKENEKFLNEGNTISFGQDTATLFYQKEPYFTGDKIKVLKSTLQQFEQKEALFFISSLNKAFSNFSWGSSRFNVKTIGNQIFNLPVREDNQIDFDFINSFMRQLEIEFLEVLKNYLAASGAPDFCFTKEETLAIESLKTKKFKNFKVTDIFNIRNTSSLLSREIISNSGSTPYLSASAENNGVNSFISYDSSFLNKGNCVFIGGKTFVVSYQEKDFFSNDSHNLALYLKEKKYSHKDILLGLATCINLSLRHKYSWGNSISSQKIKHDFVTLPLEDGQPDFEFLGNLTAALKKLVLKTVDDFVTEKTSELVTQ